MRENLFRGKRTDNGEWVYGSFCMDALELKNGLCGVDGFIRRYDADAGKMQMYEVDRETVGQFSGLTDKNGKKIFEGDVLLVSDTDTAIVEYDETAAMFMTVFGYAEGDFTSLCNQYPDIKIIGNIHDNPELLEAKHHGKD